jgi:carboxypeptidase Q
MSLPRLNVFAALFLVAALSLPVARIAAADDQTDLENITRIRQEGFRDSQVMKIMSQLTDEIGPRLTGSPNMKRANDWTRDQFTAWGLTNAHLEPWGPFGKGWSQEYVSVRMTSPDVDPLYAIPLAWTPGTNGTVKAKAVQVKIEKPEDMEKYRGKLAGAVVLFGDMRDVKPHSEAELKRYDEKSLDELSQYAVGSDRRLATFREEYVKRLALRKQLRQFWADEKVAAVIEPSRGDGGTLFVQSGGSYKPGEEALVPMLVMAVEHYGRISRLLERDVPVELELDIRTKFYDNAETQFNTVAEIPGSDKKDEIVMLGAHLDSWHAGTGATDNAAGSAVSMEAVRILKALGIKPRRTIRIALWSGEEEGLLGSRAYAAQHFGSRPESNDPAQKDLPSFLREERGPLQLKPEQAKVSAYFNIDNGTGKIRGVYCQENSAVAPIFTSWLQPFHDLGANTISMRNTGGTDHLSFDAVGIPGFQFIQDPVEYETRTHHSNMDVYERLQKEDLMQAAVVLASFVYEAAMRDQMLPRKPLPKEQPRQPERQSQTAFVPLYGGASGRD